MLNVFGRALRRRRALPVEGFFFGRPLVVLQSDDWGRVGIRDGEGWEELRSLGVNLGERNYDFYSLETAEDIEAIVSLLQSTSRFEWTARLFRNELHHGECRLCESGWR